VLLLLLEWSAGVVATLTTLAGAPTVHAQTDLKTSLWEKKHRSDLTHLGAPHYLTLKARTLGNHTVLCRELLCILLLAVDCPNDLSGCMLPRVPCLHVRAPACFPSATQI